MRRIEAFIAIMLFLFSYAHARNSQIGFEKKEIGISGKEVVYEFRTETYLSLSYAISNKFEIGVGYGKSYVYDKCFLIDSDINFHFYPKNKYDFYVGSGFSWCENPNKFQTDYMGGLFSIGINYWFIKNFSLVFEEKGRFLFGTDRGIRIMNRPFLGIKFAF